jgi:predicted component of type VI protein secretion system
MERSIKNDFSFLLDKIYIHNYGFIDYKIDVENLEKGILILNNCEFFLNNTYLNYPTNANILSRNLQDDNIKNNSSIKFYLGIKKLYQDNTNIEVKHIKDLKNKNSRYINIETELEQVSNIYQKEDKIDFSYVKHLIQIFSENEISSLIDYDLIPLCVIKKEDDNYHINTSFIPPIMSIHKNKELSKLIYTSIEKLKDTIKSLEKDKLKSKNIIMLTSINPLIVSIDDIFKNSYVHPYNIFSEIKKIISILIIFTKSYSMESLIENNSNFLSYNHEDLFTSFNLLNIELEKILEEIIIEKIEVQNEFTFNFNKNNDKYNIDIDDKFFNKEYSFYLEFISNEKDELIKDINYLKISNSHFIEQIIVSSISDIEYNLQRLGSLKFPTQSNSVYVKLNTYVKSWEKIKDSKDLSVYIDHLNIKDINLLIVDE